MTMQRTAVAILPSTDLDASAAFYQGLGFQVIADHGHYRILADGRGLHLHLNRVQGWPQRVEDNPLGLYLYVEDVDAMAERMRGLVLHPGVPERKPWGTYEFAVSDPVGTLVRVGRVLGD